MNYPEAIEFLINYKPVSDRPCPYCHAQDYDSVSEIMDAFLKCNNCLVDIQSKGQWSGHGIQALQKIIKLDPVNPIWVKMFELLRLTDGGGKGDETP